MDPRAHSHHFVLVRNGQTVSLLNPVEPTPPREEPDTLDNFDNLRVLAACAIEEARVMEEMRAEVAMHRGSGRAFLRTLSPAVLEREYPYPMEEAPPSSPSRPSEDAPLRLPFHSRRGLPNSREGVPSAPLAVPALGRDPVPAAAAAAAPVVPRRRTRRVVCGVAGCTGLFSSKNIADHRKSHVLEAAGGSEAARQPCKACERTGKACMVSTSPTSRGVNTYSCLSCLTSHRGCSHKGHGRAKPRPRRHPALDSPSR
ncbi:hypothetical protein N0V84_008631 [Fusarium piperis]|uniref:Uncharacterized protein n=1 Tax=Fusarium piperis TaxID=1435070 RepID=A0A9W8W7S8_9HYPO|nr:hypothetical protein N0V84_008631 [Fusarium piperis]